MDDALNIPVFLRGFQPKGGVCATCTKRLQDCSQLDFARMPVIGRDGNVRIVRCTEHVRSNDSHHSTPINDIPDVLLGNLPPEHLLRNTPLIEIGAQYKWNGGGSWKAVTPKYAIAGKTFNELGSAWTCADVWKATLSSPDGAHRAETS